jgi:hypothetical protein
VTKRLKNLKIVEVASCAKGINPDANVVFAKAHDERDVFEEPLIKSVFDNVLKKQKINNAFWDMKYALTDSISMIWEDVNSSVSEKATAIEEVANDFAKSLSEFVEMNKGCDKKKKDKKEEVPMEKTYTQQELDAAISKAVEEGVKKALESKDVEVQTLKAVAELSGEEKSFYESLTDVQKSEFLKKSKDQRQFDVSKAKDAEEVITINGSQVRKSAVGETVFAVFKAQQEEIQKARDAAATERTAREDAEFVRKAETDYPNTPGDPVMKGQMLKSIGAIQNQAVRDGLLTMWKAANDSYNSRFNSFGTSQPSLSLIKSAGTIDGTLEAGRRLDDMVAKKAAELNVSKSAAYASVLASDEGQELARIAQGTR